MPSSATFLKSQVFYTRTSRGNRIACMFVKCAPNARFTILHSHGNAVDLGQMSSFYLGLGSRWEWLWLLCPSNLFPWINYTSVHNDFVLESSS